MAEQKQQPQQHFLLVTYFLQSHVNPALQLARRLTATGAHVTFSTTVSGHRLMFPTNPVFPINDPTDPLLTYSPFSDGQDDGYDRKTDGRNYMSTIKLVGYETLRPIASAAATPEKPAVTCIICSILLPWVTTLARDLDLRSALFWNQAATIFSIYYHYFHDYRGLIDSHRDRPSFEISLPCLPPIKIKDLPSFIANQSEDDDYSFLVPFFGEMYQLLDEEAGGNPPPPRILVHTFESLEPEVIGWFGAKNPKFDLIPIGPLLPEYSKTNDLAEWLDKWPTKSVVYLSFGSLAMLGKKQREEFSKALVGSGRPYVWVVRGEKEGIEDVEEKGMVVEWCSQVDVLSHASVGCFVTHCGWNSTLESLACGVPMVALPQWSDQAANAWLVEAVWGTGVRMEGNGEGVVEEGELRRCLDLVMNDGGSEIRRKAEALKEKARKAMAADGDSSSRRNLEYFVNGVIGATD